jgi:hypothetical protein
MVCRSAVESGGKAMRRSAAVLVIAAVIALGTAQIAAAVVQSHISIAFNHTTERFHGRVTSSNSECQAHRTVRLFKKTATGRSLQGKTKTGPKGGWSIEVMHAHGHYFAVTPQQTIMNVACGRARSATIDVM